ncbi:MAG: DUF3732 domain-containing protein [Planctomycetes bacterium]|nr:DUF3732 domain-containing protein [Planctomycetota bacterium]
MSRWQIKSVLFYSHDNRRVELPFKLNDVTIIVGESYSGKSAIIEAVDYAMGASQCHIPGIVRETCSWVGILWIQEKSEFLICRRVPPLKAKSSEDVYVSIGAPVSVPEKAEELSRTTNVDGALRQFEQAILIGDVTGTTFTEREGTRISVRNALPYILVSDDVIIDKIALFRGVKEWRQAVIDSIPYFLGAVDETTATNEIKLKKLRSQLGKLEARQESTAGDTDAMLGKAKELLREAIEVGIIANQNLESLSRDQVSETLSRVASWVPGSEIDSEANDQLASLYALEREFLADLAHLRGMQNTARSAVQTAGEFTSAIQEQRSKLQLAELFKAENYAESCPLCNSSIATNTPTLANIQSALAQLDGELKEVNEDRPQIDAYLRTLDGKIVQSVESLKRVRGQISAIVRQAQDNTARLQGDPRRMRVVGRVSFFNEQATEDLSSLSEDKIQQLRDKISDLESLVDSDSKAERVIGLQHQVSTHATAILKELPFDVNYRNAHLMFDARKLLVKFVIGPRVMEMRDVGGDESYLSGRLSTILAIHRVFAEGKRPVPGVVILDQLSRPFYNPETRKEEVIIKTTDSTDLKRYFDAIFTEADTQKLQIIVLEHAYFEDFPKYVSAVIKRWGPKEKLIPADWPRIDDSGAVAPAFPAS